MVTIIITTKKGVIHTFSLEKGDDFIYMLDKFLKKHKLVVSSLKKVSVHCGDEGSMLCRIVKTIASGITFTIESTK